MENHSPLPPADEVGPGEHLVEASVGQAAFDVAFGIVTPVLLFATDALDFSAKSPWASALPAYWAGPAYVAAAFLVVGLLAWILTGMARPWLGIALAGPFGAGAVVAILLGVFLLPRAVLVIEFVTGWLSLTPWLTALVLGRHCLLALRAGSRASVGLSLFAGLGGASLSLIALFGVGAYYRGRSNELIAKLFSEDAAVFEEAVGRIRGPQDVDFDEVERRYDAVERLEASDPRVRKVLERVKDAYSRLRGRPIDARRAEPGTLASGGKQGQKRQQGHIEYLVGLLRSGNVADQERATNELQMLSTSSEKAPKAWVERIARLYAELAEGDPRRPRVAEAYYLVAGEAAEPLEGAVQRVQKPSAAAKVEDALTSQLFSTDEGEHKKARDKLFELSYRAGTDMKAWLEPIVARYISLDKSDPRRERINQAYRLAASEDIELAVRRLTKPPFPEKDEGPRPRPKAPAPATPTPSHKPAPQAPPQRP